MRDHSMTRRRFLRAMAAAAAPTLVPAGALGMTPRDPRPPSPASVRRVDEYCAGYFGCSPRDFSQARTLVLPHEALRGYDGVLAFRRGESCVVSVPDSVPDVDRANLGRLAPAEAFDPRCLSAVFLVRPEKVGSPARLGIADRDSFTPARSGARRLEDRDEDALWSLAGQCGERLWCKIRYYTEPRPLFGLFRGKDLVAIAGYVVVGNAVAHMGTLVPRANRGKGYEREVMSAAVADAVGQGHVALGRTSPETEMTEAWGGSLGFHPYASTLKVEIEEDTF